jgi:hypothetical protein
MSEFVAVVVILGMVLFGLGILSLVLGRALRWQMSLRTFEVEIDEPGGRKCGEEASGRDIVTSRRRSHPNG